MPADDAPTLTVVGVAHTPYSTPADAPHQGFADDAESTIDVFDEYAEALEGLTDVVRLTVVYWADEADRSSGRDGEGADVGAFARRTPNRPNPLNICTCLLLDVEGARLRVTGLDAVDGSPVLDVKPALQPER